MSPRLHRLRARINKRLSRLIAPLAPEQAKYLAAMAYWHRRFADNGGEMSNAHYRFFCTEFFGLDKSDFDDLRLLDVGCGPRGSLEWADKAARRVGLDPLADRFRSLRTGAHAMEYVAAPAERIPFPDGYFDCVLAFNSLDHTADPAASMREMIRVLRAGGRLLAIVEVNHGPTRTEPHRLDPGFFAAFADALQTRDLRLYPVREDHNIYRSLREGEPDVPFDTARPAILAAHLVRV